MGTDVCVLLCSRASARIGEHTSELVCAPVLRGVCWSFFFGGGVGAGGLLLLLLVLWCLCARARANFSSLFELLGAAFIFEGVCLRYTYVY